MFVLVLAVPALLVVVAGYVVGYGVWTAIVGSDGAEAAGWATGAVALALAVRVVVLVVRRRRR
jgi:hypothetical protein